MVVGYLSGAPMVSTHPNAESIGPRAHVLGMLNAFRELGVRTECYIVGDKMREPVVRKAQEFSRSSSWRMSLADVGRLVLGWVNERHAFNELGPNIDVAYERLAAFQALGRRFKKHGIPWIVETNGLYYYEAKHERQSIYLDGIARRLEGAVYRDCDLIISVSTALRDSIIDEFHVDPTKIIVVPNGVDTNHFDPGRYVPIRVFDSFTVGFVGSLISWQGIDLLLHAIHDLRCEGKSICAVIVGDGPQRGEWESLASTLGIADHVRFIGRVSWSDVPRYIAGFDVGYSGQVPLKCRDMYHSPLKLYEYMSMAKPVVASAFPDAIGLITQGVTGWLFSPGNVADLSAVLRSAYASSKYLRDMGGHARALIRDMHSWTARVMGIMPIIEHLVASSPRNQLRSAVGDTPLGT